MKKKKIKKVKKAFFKSKKVKSPSPSLRPRSLRFHRRSPVMLKAPDVITHQGLYKFTREWGYKGLRLFYLFTFLLFYL